MFRLPHNYLILQRKAAKPSKRERFLTKNSSGSYTIIQALENVRKFILCSFAGVDEVRVVQLKLTLLDKLENLIKEVNSVCMGTKRKFDGAYITSVIQAHSNLFNEVAA